MSVTQLYIMVPLVKRIRKFTLGSRAYANDSELVFIIGASLNICARPSAPTLDALKSVRTEESSSASAHEARTFLSEGHRTCYTPKLLQRTDALTAAS